MRKIMCTLVPAALALLTAPAARAETSSKWNGTEVLTSAQTNFSVFRASVTYFWIPKADVGIFFSYFGPKLKLGDWGWISPQVGAAGNWKNQKDFFDASLWAFAEHKGFSVFLEGDYLVARGQKPDVYSFGSLDYSWSRYNAGLHSEGVNKLFGFGPHLGLTKSQGDWSWHGELQYYLKPDGDTLGHAIRIVNGLTF